MLLRDYWSGNLTSGIVDRSLPSQKYWLWSSKSLVAKITKAGWRQDGNLRGSPGLKMKHSKAGIPPSDADTRTTSNKYIDSSFPRNDLVVGLSILTSSAIEKNCLQSLIDGWRK